jgi:hypothetical protein
LTAFTKTSGSGGVDRSAIASGTDGGVGKGLKTKKTSPLEAGEGEYYNKILRACFPNKIRADLPYLLAQESAKNLLTEQKILVSPQINRASIAKTHFKKYNSSYTM